MDRLPLLCLHCGVALTSTVTPHCPRCGWVAR
jgi:predicted RNA-binding Zn-ribbon protein involved in translation (DUF1610 family)